MITGANEGIGKATALGLTKQSATVMMTCHNRDVGEAAQNDIKAESDNQAVDLLLADLSSHAAIRELVHDFWTRHAHLHVLINNAGIAPVRRSVTVDGIKGTLAVDYLAPFLLANLLFDRLKASAPARVVNAAGEFHRKATILFDDLMSEHGYSGKSANNQAK